MNFYSKIIFLCTLTFYSVVSYSMNKTEMVDAIAADAGLSKPQANAALESFIEILHRKMAAGEQVVIPELGTFSIRARAARTERNPKTGEAIHIPASNIPSFKVSKALKQAANNTADVKVDQDSLQLKTRGVVKWFNKAKGFGFISPDDGSPDVFVHFSAIEMKDFRTLKEGEKVTYEVKDGPKGPQAMNVIPD